MRTMSTQESTVWANGSMSIRVRVIVNDGVSSRELNDLVGHDWIKSVSYSDSIEDTLATANIKCFSHLGNYALSPWMSTSSINSSPNDIL